MAELLKKNCIGPRTPENARRMFKPVPASHLRSVRRIAGVGLMLALLLFLGAAVACPDLHAAVCPDAGKPTDSCAVALFGAGLVEPSVTLALCLAIVLGICMSLPWRPEANHKQILFGLTTFARPPPV